MQNVHYVTNGRKSVLTVTGVQILENGGTSLTVKVFEDPAGIPEDARADAAVQIAKGAEFVGPDGAWMVGAGKALYPDHRPCWLPGDHEGGRCFGESCLIGEQFGYYRSCPFYGLPQGRGGELD